MLSYSISPLKYLKAGNLSTEIPSFISDDEKNIDKKTLKSFGEEWTKFSHFSDEEIKNAGEQYFDIVTAEMVNENSFVLDVGCGTGRWAKYLSPKVKFIEAIDPSSAVFSACKFLENTNNIRVTQASVDNIPFEDKSFDFVFSLGVLHHIPDAQQALNNAVKKLKDKGYFLLYLYYNLENRGLLYKMIFHIVNLKRKFISQLPSSIKTFVCDMIAFVVYFPLVCFATFIKFLFPNKKWYSKIPLSYYIGKSFTIIRNDALDRFGTPLEKRFSKKQILNMMTEAGLSGIIFSENEPFWHAIGKKIV